MTFSGAAHVFVRDCLFFLFGQGTVDILPTASAVDQMGADRRWDRTVAFVFGLFPVMVVVSMVVLEVSRVALNAFIRGRGATAVGASESAGGTSNVARNSLTERLLPCCDSQGVGQSAGGEDTESARLVDAARKKRIAGFDKQDLVFEKYAFTYKGFCLALVIYAINNDFLSENFGMDWEIYIPWVVATFLIHMGCLFYVFVSWPQNKTELPSTLTVIPNNILNPFCTHFCAMRDSVVAGIYLQHNLLTNDILPLVFSALTVLAIVFPSMWVLDVHPLRDYQAGYWPIVINFERLKLQKGGKPLVGGRGHESQPGWGELLSQLARWDTAWQSSADWQDWLTQAAANWKHWLLQVVDKIDALAIADKQTRQDMQAVAAFGDAPKAVYGLIFYLFYDHGQSRFVWLVSLACIAKATCVLLLRPHILHLLAVRDLPWQRLTVFDVWRVVQVAERRGRMGGMWVHYGRAFRSLLEDEDTPLPVREQVMKEIRKLPMETSDLEQGSANEDAMKEKREKESLRCAILREMAKQPERSEFQEAAKLALFRIDGINANRTSIGTRAAGMDVVPVLRRLQSLDTDEVKSAARQLITNGKEWAQYAGAYVSDLVVYMGKTSPALTAPLSLSRTDVPKDEQDREKQELEQEFLEVREVRYAAARALGAVEGHAEGYLAKEVSSQVLDLLGNGDRAIRSAALSAVVQFSHAEEVEAAVMKALDLLDCEKHPGEECRVVAEVVLVKLLPLMPATAKKQDCVRKIAGFVGGDDSSVSRAAADVLGRMGAGAAEEVLAELEVLSAGDRPKLKEDDLQELKTIVECQKRAAEGPGGQIAAETGCNLVLNLKQENINTVQDILKEVVSAGGEVFPSLSTRGLAKKLRGDAAGPENDEGLDVVLPVFFTDLEPDDLMFVAEMWKYLREQTGSKKISRPLVIFCADLERKDVGQIFEKKLLLAALMLGPVDFRVLTPDPELDLGKKEGAHDLDKKMKSLREDNLRAVVDRIQAFREKEVKLYICSPGRGNLGALVKELKGRPGGLSKKQMEKGVASVSLYSGSYNIGNMSACDLDALYELVGKEGVLTDASKYPFFGEPDNHKLTQSFTTFALPSFSPLLSSRHPLIAATWSLFNDEFNKGLVAPKKLFKHQVHPDTIQDLERTYSRETIEKYAQQVRNNQELMSDVRDFKKGTLQAFACGSCDAPLCDQLIFLIEWVKGNQPRVSGASGVETWVKSDKGKWNFNKRYGFTSVQKVGLGMPGKQPVMREHHDIEALYKMSEALQKYTLDHLEDLSESMDGTDTSTACWFSAQS